MKRFMFALGLLATVAISQSEAGYLIIRIVLDANAGEAATPGGLSGPGGMMRPSGPKSGPSGIRPGPLSGSQPMSKGGFYGPPGGKSPKSNPMNSPPKNFPGPGYGKFPGPMGPGGAEEKPEPEIHDPRQSIYVVIPYTNDIATRSPFYKKRPEKSHNPAWTPSIQHQFGYANLIDDNTSIQIYMDLGSLAPKGVRTLHKNLHYKYFQWKIKKNDPQQLFDAISLGVEEGFLKDAWNYAIELGETTKDTKGLNPDIDHFLKAFAKIREPIERPTRVPGDSAQWKERLSLVDPGVRILPTPHYHVIYWNGMDGEAKRRGEQLEENLRGFYMSHALRGVALPMPAKPLIAVLPRSPGDVRKLAVALDGSPFVADGFYSADFDLVVLSPERLDSVGQSFHRQVQQMFSQGVSRSMLLAGGGPRINEKDDKDETKTAEEVARMQTWTVVERFMEEEMEWSAVSREGCRQLMRATGQLPPHVALPNWLAEGSANYWQRPHGPVFTQRGTRDIITVALSTGYGVPNFVRQREFAELLNHHQFDPPRGKDKESPRQADPGQMVLNVVTDRYFHAAAIGLDADNPMLPLPQMKPKKKDDAPDALPEPEDVHTLRRQRAEFLRTKAQATSWALYYYLAKMHSAGLNRYLAELRKMPRDMPLDPETQVRAFVQAFNIAPTLPAKDGKPTMSEFGLAWLKWMKTVPVAGIDVALVDIVPPKDDAANPKGPRSGRYRPYGK